MFSFIDVFQWLALSW